MILYRSPVSSYSSLSKFLWNLLKNNWPSAADKNLTKVKMLKLDTQGPKEAKARKIEPVPALVSHKQYKLTINQDVQYSTSWASSGSLRSMTEWRKRWELESLRRSRHESWRCLIWGSLGSPPSLGRHRHGYNHGKQRAWNGNLICARNKCSLLCALLLIRYMDRLTGVERWCES